MSLRPHEQLCPTEIDWVGEIPSYWEIRKLKGLVSLLTEKGNTHSKPVGLENIESWSGRYLETETEFEGDGIAFKVGDLLFGKLRPYLAKVWLAKFSGEAVGDFHVLRTSNSIDARFLAFVMLNRTFISIVDGSTFGAKMPRVGWEFMGKMPIPLPPLPEQRAIAAFLDAETSKIDALVAEQRRLIELLKEKRQAVISHAVTKGLNPHVKMKPSGIDWLGEVPEHWEVLPLKHITILKSGEGITSESINEVGEFPVYGGNGVRGFTSSYTHSGHYVIIGRQGALCGNVNYGNGKFWASEHAVVADPKLEIDTLWFGEMIRSMNLNQYSVTAAQPGLSMAFVGNLRTVLPPLLEQQKIARYLLQKISEFDSLIEKNGYSISLLQERRTALISAAVTGKIDIRDFVPKDATA
jgi:type I restriction enzyme S subunit